MTYAEYLLALLPAVFVGGACASWLSRRKTIARKNLASNQRRLPALPKSALPVHDADRIISITGQATALIEVRRQSGLNDLTWQTYVTPVIRSVAETVQQLPASESHHHAQPGGLFIHTVETLQHAGRLRQGRILPPGADVESLGSTRHRWTVGLYTAALLHDVGKTISDLKVTLFTAGAPEGIPWQAMMGSMLEAKALAYVVDFPRGIERDYQAHQRLGVQLMQRLLPPETRIWLSYDPVLLEHLLGYLSGDAEGPIAEIVREAEAESVRRNLESGSRVRFATSRSTPLIELLMYAMRSMLAEGGRLPLNRPGAAGFCDGTDIWFAAVRLANEVRDWLRQSYPKEPVPGEALNDRLYDTWQEYGACKTRPDTQGAIWAARIEFVGGRTIELGALLCFPLALLYAEPALYPKPLEGRIVPVLAPALPSSAFSDSAVAGSDEDSVRAIVDDRSGAGQAIDDKKTEPPAPKQSDNRKENSTDAESTPRLPDIQSVGAISQGSRKPKRPTPVPNGRAPEDDVEGTDYFLEEQDCATAENQPRANSHDPPRFAGPVIPHVVLPMVPMGKNGTTPSDAALRFMGWLQQGLADGSLPYNVSSALVHFVKVMLRDGVEEIMMLLVSPAVFRRFAETYGDPQRETEGETLPEMLGMGIQTEFTRAGWHLPAGRGRNIHRFQVIRRGDGSGSLLNGFLVAEPERFVNPLPPPNERLRYWSQSAAAGSDRVRQA